MRDRQTWTVIGAAGLLTLAAACSGSSSKSSNSAATSGSTTTPGSSTTPGTSTPPATLRPPTGRYYSGDLHVHSRHSGDTKQFGDQISTIIRLAETTGLQFLSISDHRQTTVLTDPQFRGTSTNLIMLAGEEWGGSGHAGAHNLQREPIQHSQDYSGGAAAVAPRINDVIDDVHAQGGFFVLNHPIEPDNPFYWDVDGFDGMEIWNQSWALRNLTDTTDADVRQWVASKGLSAAGLDAPPEVYQAVSHQGGGRNYQNLKFYEAHLDAGKHLAAVGGGDRHYLFRPGYPTTWVFAETPTPAGISDGVRRARTWVSRGPDAPRVDFRADRDGDGIFESILGDVIPLTTTGAIDFQIAVEDNAGGKVELVRNGTVIGTWHMSGGSTVIRTTDQPSGRSWYRVNVYEPIDRSGPDAAIIEALITGGSLSNLGFLGSTIAGLLGQYQSFVDVGGPFAIYMILFGSRAGITQVPINTASPTLLMPEYVSRLMNIDLRDRSYCIGALTSAIYVE